MNTDIPEDQRLKPDRIQSFDRRNENEGSIRRQKHVLEYDDVMINIDLNIKNDRDLWDFRDEILEC